MKKVMSIFLSLTFIFCMIPFAIAQTITGSNDLFSYTVLENGTISVKKKSGAVLPAVLEIPAEIDGYQVTDIGTNAFAHCDTIEKVIIPDAVTKIGTSAFTEMALLQEITLPQSLEEIGMGVFSTCKLLKKITIPDNVKTINSITFWKCIALEEVILPRNLEKISTFAFWECESLKKIIMPENLKEIDSNAFRQCISLEEVIFPQSLEKIASQAFKDCKTLKKISLPENVKNIGDYAFQGCTSLSEAIFEGNKLTAIPSGMFSDCSSLKSLCIPEGVTRLGEEPVTGATALTDIYFPLSITNNTYLINMFFKEYYVYCGPLENPPILENPTDINYSDYKLSRAVIESLRENVTLHCYKNSVVETFAITNMFKYVIIDSKNVVSVSVTGSSLYVGETKKFTVTILPSDAIDKSVVWSSDNEDIATVDSAGNVTGVSDGTVKISATSVDGNKTGSATVEVKLLPFIHVSNIYLPYPPTKYVGQEFTLKATIYPSDATDKSVIWSSDNENVATVDSNGCIKCISVGTAEITVTTVDGNKKDTVTVNVKSLPAPTAITIQTYISNAYVGDSFELSYRTHSVDSKDYNVVWISNNPDVATIDQNGTVIALSPGVCDIIVQIAGTELKDYMTIFVYDNDYIETIFIEGNSERELEPGEKITLRMFALPEGLENRALWTSSNPEVASVNSEASEEAIVTALSAGHTIITATSVKDPTKKATCKVTVKSDTIIDSLSIPSEMKLLKKSGYLLKATITPEGTSMPDLVWRTSDSNVASVFLNGYVAAINCGSAIITVSTADGRLSATCSVTVVDELSWQGGENVVCTYDAATNTLTVSGSGDMYDNLHSYDRTYPADMVHNVIIGPDITSIGDYAFYECPIKSVQLPEGLKSIGKFSFSMTDLTEIIIPDTVTSMGVGAFTNCIALTSVELSKNLKKIPVRAFNNTILKSLIVPEGVTEIEDNAFSYISNKEPSLSLPESLRIIGDSAFAYSSLANSFIIPNGVDYIGDYAFIGNKEINIVVPASVTHIGVGALHRIDSIADQPPVIRISVDKDNLFYSSQNGALFNKDKTTLIYSPVGILNDTYDIPEGVEKVEDYAFMNNLRLKNLFIPASVRDFSKNAFSECSWLTSITVDSESNYYKDIDGILFSKDGKTLICFPYSKNIGETYVVPDSVKTIASNAFPFVVTGGPAYGSSKLKRVVMQEGVETIEANAFALHNASFVLPRSLISIDEKAFEYCTLCLIYCYKNSYAKEFADKFHISSIIIKETEPLNISDTDTGILIEAPYGVVPQDTTMTATGTSQGKLSDIYKDNNYGYFNITKFMLYDIKLMSGSVEIQPNGFVKVSIPLPENYNASAFRLCYVSKDPADSANPFKTLEFSIQDGYAVFETDHFSEFGFIEAAFITTKVSIKQNGKAVDDTISQKLGSLESYKNAEMYLDAAVSQNNVSGTKIVWSSSNSRVRINENGKITNESGIARSSIITASVVDKNGNVIATSKVKVIFYKTELFRWLLSI